MQGISIPPLKAETTVPWYSVGLSPYSVSFEYDIVIVLVALRPAFDTVYTNQVNWHALR